jgi:hypothetical protein
MNVVKQLYGNGVTSNPHPHGKRHVPERAPNCRPFIQERERGEEMPSTFGRGHELEPEGGEMRPSWGCCSQT